jgi:hypothetical protein
MAYLGRVSLRKFAPDHPFAKLAIVPGNRLPTKPKVEPETEAESTETEEADAEAETTDETGQPDGEVLKALKPKAIKRFNQMLSQRDEALREAREAKAERDALKTQIEQPKDEPQAVIKTSDPLARVTNEEQLEAHETFYRSVRSWCRSHPHGGVPPVELTGGREIEMDAEQVGRKLDEYESLLEAVPKRRELLASFKAERTKVREAMPEMFKAGTPENTAHDRYQRKLLNFDTQADQDDIIRKLIKVDRMEREEREGVRYTRVETKKVTPATTAQPGAKPAPKPAPVAARTPAVRPSGTKTGQQAAWDKLKEPQGAVDIEELMEA